MTNKLTFEEFVITDSVFNQIKNNPELYDFHLSLFNNLEINPLLKWTYETLKNHQSLYKVLNIEEKTHQFTINSYYYLLQLASNNEDINITWSSSIEIAQETIIELFRNYDFNKNKI